jgi:hypothetical protein
MDNTNPDPEYDAMDYAHDMADFLGAGGDPEGTCGNVASQNSLIYAIGLGKQVAYLDGMGRLVEKQAPKELLNYIVSPDVGQGLYYRALDSTDPTKLRDIFLAIANKIATILVK